MSVPQRNWSCTCDAPSRLIELIAFTPGTRATERSTGSVTKRSTSEGPASGYCVQTLSVGKATSGSRSTGRRAKATAPSSTTATKAMAVATGRRIERSGRAIEGRSRGTALKVGALATHG